MENPLRCLSILVVAMTTVSCGDSYRASTTPTPTPTQATIEILPAVQRLTLLPPPDKSSVEYDDSAPVYQWRLAVRLTFVETSGLACNIISLDVGNRSYLDEFVRSRGSRIAGKSEIAFPVQIEYGTPGDMSFATAFPITATFADDGGRQFSATGQLVVN